MPWGSTGSRQATSSESGLRAATTKSRGSRGTRGIGGRGKGGGSIEEDRGVAKGDED
jgi:hypothetical protein